MNRRQRKKALKKAHWVFTRAFDALGGDYEIWCAHGNPIVEITCSNCKACAPMQRGHEYDMNVLTYAILKKQCPVCKARMMLND